LPLPYELCRCFSSYNQIVGRQEDRAALKNIALLDVIAVNDAEPWILWNVRWHLSVRRSNSWRAENTPEPPQQQNLSVPGIT